jgi:hypothetical protein
MSAQFGLDSIIIRKPWRLVVRVLRPLAAVFLLATFGMATAHAQDTTNVAQNPDTATAPRWPYELETDSGLIVIYTPQLEGFANNAISGRAAFSYTRGGSTTPRYGTMWFTSRVDVDRDANEVTLRGFTISRVRFPNVTVAQQTALEQLVRAQIESRDITSSLDRIVALVAASETERATADNIKTEPPRIIVSAVPSVLLSYDGDPVLRVVDSTRFERVVNTPMLVVKDTLTKLFYLTGNNRWYQANDPMGPWEPAEMVPDSLRAMVPDTMDADVADAPPPKIFTAKTPTELIVSEGPLNFQPLAQPTSIKVAVNTQSDVLETAGLYYVLLSGRWYSAHDMAGPWTHVRPDSLPRNFTQIYPNSSAGDVRAFVPGTPEADEAVADALIPQTQAINRATATLTVAYEGEPDFDTIPGTNGNVSWAYNTEIPVLRVGDRYYACNEAVWFVATSATGPWTVSDSVPSAVQSIPPSSPVYNVKYVQVYESTSEVVYVGYTPGYVGAYPYYGTVVWGTGWVYPHPPVYYPRPVTYGYGMHYNPYGGWGVGVGITVGFVAVGVSNNWGRYPPGRYPPGRYPAGGGGFYGPGGYNRPGSGNVGARPGTGGARPSTRPAAGRSNIYNRPSNAGRNSARPSTRPSSGAANRGGAGGARPSTGMGGTGGRPSARPNNVFSSPSGNVMRQGSGGGWQQQGSGGWQNSRGNSTMNRDAQARSRGATREAGRGSYGGGGSRGGGGARGGGGGRRR